MSYEYKVIDQAFGNPHDVEDELNRQSQNGWEHYETITLGPIPTRWLLFRRPKKEG